MKRVNTLNLKLKRAIALGSVITAVILATVGYITLPETLIMQITFNGSAGNTMPKLLGLALPTSISLIFGLMYLVETKEQDIPNSNKHLFASLVGILVFIFIFVFAFFQDALL